MPRFPAACPVAQAVHGGLETRRRGATRGAVLRAARGLIAAGVLAPASLRGVEGPARAPGAEARRWGPPGSEPAAPSGPSPEGTAAEAPVEVVVSAERAPLLRRSLAAPTLASRALTRADLSGAGASAADVLSRVPGVQMTRTGAASDVATASLRGADARQVPIYLAGIRLNDEVSGTADLSSVPLWILDRIEVFRGNAPDRADRLGVGGAIFLWPRTPLGSGGGGAGIEVGSFAERGAHGWFQLGTPSAASIIAVRHSSASNAYPYLDDRGQRFDRADRQRLRPNADFSQTDAWAIGRYGLGGGLRVHTLISAFDREQGVTGLAVLPARSVRAHTQRMLIGVSTEIECGGDPACRLELETAAIYAGSSLRDPQLELPGLGTSVHEDLGKRASQAARLVIEPRPDLSLQLAASAAAEVLRVRGASGAERGGSRISALPTLSGTWQVRPGLSLHPLAGLECHATAARALVLGEERQRRRTRCGPSAAAARLGARLELGPALELVSNAGRYVRTPTLAELYGSTALVEGNPALEQEAGLSWDAGVRWAVAESDLVPGRFELELFAFWREVSDLIRYRRTGLQKLAPFNVGRARLLGIEATAAAAFRHAKFEAALAALDPRETTPDGVLDPTHNDILPNTARLTASAYAGAQLESGSPRSLLRRASLGVRFQHRSSRFDDPAGQIVLPPQNLFDIELEQHWCGEALVLRAAVRNALDAPGSDVVGLPLPGRSYHAALELSF